VRWQNERRVSGSAAVARPGGPSLSARGGSALVVNEVQLFEEAVERETHNIEEVAVDVLNQHAPESLDTVASGLVPDTHTHTHTHTHV